MNCKEQYKNKRTEEQQSSKQKKMKVHEYSSIQQQKWKANDNKENRKIEVHEII